jgi:hypothetical protein
MMKTGKILSVDGVPIVELMTSDGHGYTIKEHLARMSPFIRDMLDEDEVIMMAQGTEKPFRRIWLGIGEARQLAQVIKYMKYHWGKKTAKIARPLELDFEDKLCDWDRKFINSLSVDDIALLSRLADRLGMEDLLSLTAAKLASWIKGKSNSDIRALFSIPKDQSDERQAAIRKENEWVIAATRH